MERVPATTIAILWLVAVCISCIPMLQPAAAYLTNADGKLEDYIIVTTIVEELNSTKNTTETIPHMAESEQFNCLYKHVLFALQLESQGPFCEPDFDNVTCWPPTVAGQNASLACPVYKSPDLRAYRWCQANGKWDRVDYNECLNPPAVPTYPPTPALESALAYVYLVGCSLSLVLLTISLFIFCYFTSLECTRIAIHKNLVVSFILRYICMIVVLRALTVAEFSVIEGENVNYQKWEDPFKNAIFCIFITIFGIRIKNEKEQTPVLCQWFFEMASKMTISKATDLQYCCMTNIFWMFVEGMYLTSRISVAVFSRESNFKLYIFIGWVSPVYAVVTWAVLMRYRGSDLPCWTDYLESPYIWIVRAPMIAAIFINSVFLINIIRILVTKLRASNTVETAQMRKAIKAVAVLFPLLGLTNLVFMWAPSERGLSESVYSVVHAILLSAQGIFVSVIYCFLNAEVRMAISRRFFNNLDACGNNTRARRTTQTHTNGSCVLATSSEVAMAVSYQKKLHQPSPMEQIHEMKSLRNELESNSCGENNKQPLVRVECQRNADNVEMVDDVTNSEKQRKNWNSNVV